MKTYLQAYLDKLKSLVLVKSEIAQIVPADCYRLALEIKSMTHKSVSETTLKRVFGFASSVHQPSIYTLNALAEYCGFASWNDFYTCMEQDKLERSQQRTWAEISLNATKISLFNIQSNKHKCGIPYHLTIDRQHMRVFIDRFHESGATIGILSGGVGHGKTIAVSRWVENRVCQNEKPDHDIYLFTNTLALLQASAFGYHSNRWLAHLLGFDSSDLLDMFMETHHESAPGNFYLIIDELHTDLVAERQFHIVITQFIEMVRHFAKYKWFRMVLILRTATLFKYESLFKDTIINPQWFSMFSGTMGNQSANLPAFTDMELHQLIGKIKGKTEPCRLPRPTGKRLIHTPLFFQYYYELQGENLELDKLSSFDEHMIIARYLKKKVFNGINTVSKQVLMGELAPLIEERNGIVQISKKQAHSVIKQHRSAYNDLIYAGLVYEVNSETEIRNQVSIQFQSTMIAAYMMAVQLFNGEQHAAPDLIPLMDQSRVANRTKIEQLKWLLLFYIESGDLRLADEIGNIPFIKENRFEIVAFICDGLDKLSKSLSPSVRNEINRRLYKSPFIEYTLNYTCFETEYESNVAKLLAFDLSELHEIILRSKLAVIALLKWEEDALLRQLEALSLKSPDSYADFIINPLNALSFLYQYFKSGVTGEVEQELNMIPHRLPRTGSLPGDQLFDLLIYLWVKVSGNEKTAWRYRDFMRLKLERINTVGTFEADFTSLVYAFYLLECGDTEAAVRYASQGSPASMNRTAYRLLYIIFTIQAGKLSGSEDLRTLGQRAISICETYGFKLLEAFCRILILDEVPKDEQAQHINNLKFQFAAFGYTMGLEVRSRKYG